MSRLTPDDGPPLGRIVTRCPDRASAVHTQVARHRASTFSGAIGTGAQLAALSGGGAAGGEPTRQRRWTGR